MWVCLCLQSEWFVLGLPPGVTQWEVQLQDMVIEHRQYYNEKSTSCSRHYYDCT